MHEGNNSFNETYIKYLILSLFLQIQITELLMVEYFTQKAS
jgi:hypothetical protein